MRGTLVWTVRLADLRSPIGILEEAAVDELVADAREDLLLARGAREVRLPGGLPDPGVGQRRPAVEMVPAGRDGEAVVEAALGVGRVAEAALDVDVDATEAGR